MDIQVIIENFGGFANGLWITLQLLFFSLFFGILISFVVVAMRCSHRKILSYSAWFFIYFFRGTPLLVQIYIIYYGLGQFQWLQESPLWFFFKSPYLCGILALSLNNAGYTSEIFHHSICTIRKGEREACIAFGMNTFQYLHRFLVPNMFRRSLQAYSNEVIFMLHGTSLVGIITVLDITAVARRIYADYYIPFEAFITAGLLYLCCSFVIAYIFRLIERKTSIPGMEAELSKI